MSVIPKKIKDNYKVIKVYGPPTGILSSGNMRIVQNWGYDQNIAPEHFNEMGNSKIVSTDYPGITTDVTIDTNLGNLSMDNLREICNKAANAIITQDDFENAICDILVPTTQDGVTTHRTLVLPYQFLTGYDVNFSLEGVATEAFRFSGGMDEELHRSYATAIAQVFDSATVSGDDTHIGKLTESGSSYAVVLIYADGVKYSISDNEVAQGNPTGSGWGKNAVIVGKLVTNASRYTVIQARTGEAFSEIVSADSDIGGVKGDKVRAYLEDGGDPTSSGRWFRLQGASVSFPLDRPEIKELGTSGPIDRSLNYPIPMTVSFDVLENDLSKYCKAAGQQFNSTNFVNPQMFQGNDDLQFVVRVFDDDPDLSASRVIYTISGQNLRVNGRGVSHAVGGNAAVRWEFTFDTVGLNDYSPAGSE